MSVAYSGPAGNGLGAYGEQKQSAFGDQRFGAPAPTPIAAAAPALRDLERQYHVVLQDTLGHPALGFRDGTWFRLTVSGPQPLQLRGAIRHCPHAAGSIVQIACWWMRENPLQPRSLDLATELALTVGELVRVCPADGLGTSSQDLAPLAPTQQQVAQVQQQHAAALPPAPAAPAPMTPQAQIQQQPQIQPQPQIQQPLPQPPARSTAPSGSWFDPTDTSAGGGFPAIPPAPMMAPQAASAPYGAQTPAPAPAANGYPTGYPAAPQGYGSHAAPQAALPPTPSYAPQQPAPPRPAPAHAPQPVTRGYSDPSQQSDWDRPGVPRRPAQPPQPQRPQAQLPQGLTPPGQPRPPQGQPPQRPRPQQQRPEFRDERRDTFERRLGLEEDGPDDRGLDRSSDRLGLDRSSDRLDRSSDRLDRSSDRDGVPPRRPSASSQPPRGSMGRRPATRPGRPSDW